MAKLNTLFVLDHSSFEKIYGDEHFEVLKKLVKMVHPPISHPEVLQKPEILKDVEVIFSGWGGPSVDVAFLEFALKLRAIFYGAGSIKGIMTEAAWDRGIRISSAWIANGMPVAEFTLGAILLGGKQFFSHERYAREKQEYLPQGREGGLYHATVGIISLGTIGQRVCELLKAFDVKVLAYDPFVSAEKAQALGVELVELDEIFLRCAIVSLHTPWLKETENMIRGHHLKKMPANGIFINTARGAVVMEEELIEALTEREDLTAVLDVTYPEPPTPTSPLWKLPNVFLTPHVAGSVGPECRRMGQYMVEEFGRYLAGEPLKYEISRELFKRMA